ncbi:MAG: AMP-binding protein [Proteobacteria bacterium]|nr:AMP-binding protein [Pseudomonadota bacterium]
MREFRWPDPVGFNWARDYFDVMAAASERLALRVVDDGGSRHELSYRELAQRSSQVANYLASQGIAPGDRVLVMLGNVVPLWETMLAIIKLGAVVIPATTLLQREDLLDRLERGAVRAVVTDAQCAGRFDGLAGAPVRILVGEPHVGWLDYADSAAASAELPPQAAPQLDELLMLYFTSGTTSKPKLVAHTHRSYPVGHLSTMYWVGLQPGDVHLNLSSAGWAKHAWSCLFAPFNAEATVLAWQYERFDAGRLLAVLEEQRVTTFCAPPTVWRMLIQQDMRGRRGALRELVSAGEPLNPEVIEQVRRAWDLTVRDGYGQTETTAQIGNSPGQPLRPGSMGLPLPGYRIVLLDKGGQAAEEGEICIDLAQRPVGLMREYLDDEARNSSAMQGGYYHTGDVARRDEDGYLTYVGRMDDIFKSSDYRISPFELESVLIEHPAVAEAAVVPSPDPVRLAVPKAYVVLAAGHAADAATALSILEHVRLRVSPYKRIRCVEFSALPKTISGKIRRVDLRAAAAPGGSAAKRHPNEFWEYDFPSLKAGSRS